MDHEYKPRQLSSVVLHTTPSSRSQPAIPPSSVHSDFKADQAQPNPTRLSNDSDASSLHPSHVSSSSNTTDTCSTVPHLKRKHGSKHMRQQLQPAHATPQTSNISSTANTILLASNQPVQQTNVSQPSPSRLAQLQLTRSNTAPSPKRAPASHSSYGVETVAGPPPSFDTRRTWSQERVWRIDRSKSLRITLGSDQAEASVSQTLPSNSVLSQKEFTIPRDLAPTTPLLTQSSPDTADTQSVPTPTDAEEVAVMELRSDHGLGVSNSEVGSKTSSESHKSEDLFLNIAKVDAGRPTSSKGEKRRSRVSLPFFPASRPATSYNPEGAHLQIDPLATTSRIEQSRQHAKHASLQFGQVRGLDQTSEVGSTDVSNLGLYSKRSSTLIADTARPSQRPPTGLRNSRLVSEGGYLDRPKFTEQNATESTASTTAPSTVWDELDDLKSRIRKLELTGKLPPSSAAAMSSAERPRTATTAATTLSSSPKYNKVPATLQSTVEGTPSSVHPLLQEALVNAESILSDEIYQKLQAAAQDALQLASYATYDTQSERGGMLFATERQLRRRTESLCRNLTELAIALASERKPSQSTYRPVSRDHQPSPGMTLRSRRYSNNNEPSDRPPISNRVSSRLEARKVSTQFVHGGPRRSSTDLESPASVSQFPGSVSRSIRNSAGPLSRRNPGFFDGSNDEDQSSPSMRPMSRAMTDISTVRHLSRDHAAASREYTRQHPMPSQHNSPSTNRTPLPANMSTNLVSRRKYASPATVADGSPLATRSPYGHISIVQQEATPPSDTVSEAPGTGRTVSTRRSFGLASRIGSSVGNRLRSAKTERVESRSFKDLASIGGESSGDSRDSRGQQY